ncbi:MAG: exonuclease domain-containing protein [Paracoccaceae bacterium]
MNFVFYDLETTGISVAFDQPLQFAAIITDSNFKELDRTEFRCRIAPHILPSPYALAVTGVTPEQLIDPSQPTFFEFSQKIYKLTEQWAPAVWIGYNSIKFDEAMLRQTFYQNLQPNNYATQAKGNSRFDMMNAVYAVHAKQPDLLKWPVNEEGKKIFKLDRLAPENGFNQHNAHDALGDVEATIHLARTIANGNLGLWAQLFSNHNKAGVQEKLETYKPVEVILRYGGGDPRIYTGCFCGYAEGSSTQACFLDFENADLHDLLDATDEKLTIAVEKSPKPIRAIGTNNAPSVFLIEDPTLEQLQIAKTLEASPHFCARVSRLMASRYEDQNTTETPVELKIFNGFYNSDDKRLLQKFQEADWPTRKEIVNQFTDRRLRQLGGRLLAFYGPDAFAAQSREQFRTYLKEKWTTTAESKPDWTTFDSAFADIDKLLEEGKINSDQRTSLIEFYNGRRAPLYLKLNSPVQTRNAIS